MTPTTYELLTHRGRQITESKELGPGFCGSCSIDIHVHQMRDKKSWVHSSKKIWAVAALIKEQVQYQVIMFEDGEFLAIDNSSGGYGWSTKHFTNAHLINKDDMEDFISNYMKQYGYQGKSPMAQINKPYYVMDINLSLQRFKLT